MSTDSNPPRRPISILVFSGSLRSDSINSRLARLAATTLGDLGVTVDHADLREFDCPSYDGDVERDSGIPDGAQQLHDRLGTVDGFVVACPEYNGAMPGVVKNVIDWTSRFRPQPFHQKQCLLMSASPSMVGGNRGLWSLRVPLEHLGTRVYPEMFSLAQAHSAFADDGTIALDTLQERFVNSISGWVDLVEASKHYPCAKARWVEFLGERPEPALDRVQ